jgi:ParB/RepB/Spo0J family partition protein
MKSIHDKDVKNRTYSMYNPAKVVIVGFDTEDDDSHPLCDTISNNTATTEAGVKYAMEHGIDEPCIGMRDGDRVLIWRGRKRTRDLREANTRLEAEGKAIKLLPVIIQKGAYDAPGTRAKRVMENWLRRDLSLLDKAHEANELLEHGEATKEELAERLGVKPARLKEILDLVNLSQPAKDAVNTGRISPSAIQPLTKMSVDDQRKALIGLLAEGGKKPTASRVREATGKAEVQTPKVRMNKAAAILQALAGDLAAIVGEDNEIIGSLSQLSDAICGKTWGEMIAPVGVEPPEEEFTL